MIDRKVLERARIKQIHGCPSSYHTFEEPAFVQVQEWKELNPCTLISSQLHQTTYASFLLDVSKPIMQPCQD